MVLLSLKTTQINHPMHTLANNY